MTMPVYSAKRTVSLNGQVLNALYSFKEALLVMRCHLIKTGA